MQIATGTAGIIGLSPVSLLSGTFSENRQASESAHSDIPMRTLGKTGLEFTQLGFGAMRTSDPAVIRRGVEMGINNIDTARGYMDGENERIVAKALAGVREKVHISTKIKHGTPQQMRGDLEESLKALDTDYIDVLLRHSMKRPEDLEDEETRKFLEEAKASGKARFIGFSTHRRMASLLRAAGDDEFYDVVLTAFNFTHGEDLVNAVNYAAEKGIGIIAMKTQAGGYEEEATKNLNPHQTALKWVLSNNSVTSAIPSMVTFQQLEENHSVLDSKFGWLDRKTLDKYGHAIDEKLCRFCGACEDICPFGVPVSDLNRCVMYVDGYRDSDLAARAYREISSGNNARQCLECDECVVQCINGVNVARNMKRATELFT